jgi:hypothetical protein
MTDGACLAGERANDWWYEQKHGERITGGLWWDCNDIDCIPESDVEYDEVQNVNYQGDYENIRNSYVDGEDDIDYNQEDFLYPHYGSDCVGSNYGI